jgi:hypothetical protein
MKGKWGKHTKENDNTTWRISMDKERSKCKNT